jgi:hypothetical protein
VDCPPSRRRWPRHDAIAVSQRFPIFKPIPSPSTGTWTATEAPLPADADATNPEVSRPDVACASSACVVAGQFKASSIEGMLLSGEGSSWTAADAPAPGQGTQSEEVSAVACPSSTNCVAVGDYSSTVDGVPEGSVSGLLLSGSGSSWTATAAPVPADANGPGYPVLTSIACASAEQCVAVGDYSATATGVNPWEGLILTDSDGTWTAIKAPLPPDATTTGPTAANLLSVACPTPSGCVAVGDYFNAAGQQRGLLLTESGGRGRRPTHRFRPTPHPEKMTSPPASTQ